MYKSRTNSKRGLLIAAAIALIVIILIFLYIIFFKINFKSLDASGDAASEASGVTASLNVGSGTDAVQNPTVPLGAASQEHIKSSVFVGDFVPVALGIYTSVPNSNVLADVNMNIANIGYTKISAFKKQMTTIAAIKSKKPKSIYVCIGSNDIGWRERDDVISEYAKYVRQLKSAAPEADIYLMSLCPVTASKNNSDRKYSNAKIRKFNSWILHVAQTENVYYQDIFSALAGDNDALPNELAESDGYHIKASGCNLIIKYIMSHAAADSAAATSSQSEASFSSYTAD